MKIYNTMANGIIIAEYEESMAATIADMWNKSGDSWGGDSHIKTAQSVISDCSGSFFNIFIALDKGEAVGYCTFLRYYNDENTAYIGLLNVRPDYHGKKVGKALVLTCVNRTMEMGLPRLDLGTWPGNTKAVPLYKKCGFLWEDNGNSTHLSNFIPTVLNTELFADFFSTADWYADSTSTKSIEIKPDGVKFNKFELYGYTWEKDGHTLAVSFEKTGRRIRAVETEDYKIELMALSHELAFGLNYDATFKVENKSGKPLNVKIVGKDDEKGIKFAYTADENIDGTTELTSSFFVEPIEKNQDSGKMHPCVLADVYVNDKAVEFGLGIEPKYPLAVDFFEKRHGVTRPGIIQDVYINVKNMLPKKAEITFTIPENPMTRFFDNTFTVTAEAEETVQLSLKEEILSCGYAKADIEYAITLADGAKVAFTKPHHLLNQSVDGVLDYETEYAYCAINGLWKLSVNKTDSYVYSSPAAGYGAMNFRTPKFGKPFSEEFNTTGPTNLNIYRCDNLTIVEFDLVSKAFNGAVLTEKYEFSAAGIITRTSKVTNRSDRVIPELHLREQFYSGGGSRAVFHYDGEFHEVNDNTVYSLSGIDHEKIDENWIFDNYPTIKSGMYWDKDYHPQIVWSDELLFTHEIGELAPNDTFETKPFVYMNGVFNNVREFRNYVMGIDETVPPHTIEPLDIIVNGRNPFIDTSKNTVEAVIKNHRSQIYSGDIEFTSPELLAQDYTQTNPEKDLVTENAFKLKLNKKVPGLHVIDIGLKFQYEKAHQRILFIANKAMKVKTTEKNGVFTVNNGKISYKVAPAYSDAAFSLKYGKNEWLFSKYPNHEPYGWANPFIGGIQTSIWNMSANDQSREKSTAEFVSVEDNSGTKWTGIKTSVTIEKFVGHKGITYEQYYVTQPALPVLCHFVRFINNSGGRRHIGYNLDVTVSGTNLSDIYAQITSADKQDYRARMGDAWIGAEDRGLVRMSFEGESARTEKLYAFTDAARNSGSINAGSDIYKCSITTGANTNNLLTGEARTFRPLFLMLTEKEITLDSVSDLDRVMFDIL